MFDIQNMQTDKSVAEEVKLLTGESKLDSSGLLDLRLLSPSEFDFLPTDSIAEGGIKTAPPPPPNRLKKLLCPLNDLIHHPSNTLIKNKRLLSLFTRHCDNFERTKKPLPNICLPATHDSEPN